MSFQDKVKNSKIDEISNRIMRIIKATNNISKMLYSNEREYHIQQTKQLIEETRRELKIRSYSKEENLEKIETQFEASVYQFQQVLKQAESIIVREVEEEGEGEDYPLLQSSQQEKRVELDINEQLIAQREQDLIGLEKSIQDVSEIFRDLGVLVHEQQYLLDNIESNVGNMNVNMEAAVGELRTASNYQNKTGKRCMWIFFGLLLLLFIFLLVIHPWSW